MGSLPALFYPDSEQRSNKIICAVHILCFWFLYVFCCGKHVLKDLLLFVHNIIQLILACERLILPNFQIKTPCWWHHTQHILCFNSSCPLFLVSSKLQYLKQRNIISSFAAIILVLSPARNITKWIYNCLNECVCWILHIVRMVFQKRYRLQF